MGLEALLPYIIASATAISTAIIILYATKSRKKETMESHQPFQPSEATQRWRYRAQRSVTYDNAKEAKGELRTLNLERQILSDAIRRLYEAHAEGKITEEEREQLAKRYKSRMMTIKEAIDDNESLVALHELEAMQEDLIKLFDERFEELDTKIETLRSRVGVETEEAIIPAAIPQIEEGPTEKEQKQKTKKKTKRRKRRKSRKTKAEERIDKIRSEVEQVLDRLEQMEAET